MDDLLTCEQVRDRELAEQYALGRLSNAEAEALEAHALDCDECWEEINQAVELRAALAAVGAPREAESAPRPKTGYWDRRVAAAAVVALAFGALWYARRGPADDAVATLRGNTAQMVVTAAWQSGGGLRISWPPVPRATSYRVEVAGLTEGPLSEEVTTSSFDIPQAALAHVPETSIDVRAQNAAGEVIARGHLRSVPPPH